MLLEILSISTVCSAMTILGLMLGFFLLRIQDY